jgi:xylulokinase
MFIAVDVGTSGIKAVVLNDRGVEITVARRPIGISRPRDSWAEQDMDQCWSLVCEAITEAASSTSEIAFVAVTAQGDGCWLVGARGEAVRPAILWNDGRASRYVETWLRDGTVARGFELNGSVSFPGLPNAVLRWLADNEPEVLDGTTKILSCGSWIFSKLTGETRIEVSDASAPFLDPVDATYSDALLDLYGLAWCKRMLPPVVSGEEAVAPLTSQAARAVNLPVGTPVVLAPYDVPCAALGAGARKPGDAIAILGTTFVCGVATQNPVPEGEPSGSTIALGLPGTYLRFFPTLAGMEVLGWAAQLLGRSGPPEIVELAMTAAPGAKGLFFLPYLSPAGERAPFLDPAARGSLWNLSLEHTTADIARAIVEGLTLVLRDCLLAARSAATRLHLSGGGANSDAWCQLVADATGIETRRARGSEITARGAAFAGMIATGSLGIGAAAAAWPADGGTWRPDPRLASFYAQHYVAFCRLRELARQGWRQGDGNAAGAAP